MMGWIQSVAGIVFIFGIVVFVHELGHFLAAKLTNVYAPRFSIGFGPPLWRRRYGETEYVIAALPIGGYVRMASREDEASAFLEGGTEESRAANAATARPADWDSNALVPFGPRPVPEHRWFESKSLPQRLLIMLAGVTMNALLALVIMVAVAAGYGRPVANTRVVGAVRTPSGSGAPVPPLLAGDTVRAIGGRAVRNWEDVQRLLVGAESESVQVETQRGRILLALGAPGTPFRDTVVSSLEPYLPPVIDSVLPGRPAARAGLVRGDSVVSVGGSPVITFTDIVAKVSASPGVPLDVALVRRGALLHVGVRPAPTDAPDPQTGATRKIGTIGAKGRDVFVRVRYPLGDAVRVGARATLAMAGSVVTVVRGLFTGTVSMSTLGGPIAIARASAAEAQTGLEETLYLLALISVNLAVFNLLPIPILDGGQIVLNVAESLKGRPFSDRTRDLILRLGLAAIALLFVVVMWNDLAREIRSRFG